MLLCSITLCRLYSGLGILADTRVNHKGVLAVSNYLGSSLAAGILTFVLNSLYGFNYAKINICFFTVGNMGVMICLSQGGLHSLSASS